MLAPIILAYPKLAEWIDGTKKSLEMSKENGDGNSRTAREMRADFDTVGRIQNGGTANKKSLERIGKDLERLG